MENDLSKELVQSLLDERKQDRKWRNIRFFIRIGFFLFIILLLFNTLKTQPDQAIVHQKHYALVRLNGVITAGAEFSARKVIPELEHAFADSHAKGVLLEINSPGGSPVQSGLIHDAIMKLKQSTHKKVVVYGEDVLASGSYLVATAADKIYVNHDTLTGSIGVFIPSFDVTGAIKKLGIVQRTIRAGSLKGILDPFKTMSAEEKNILQRNVDAIHTHFINYVKTGRGKKLKVNPNLGVNSISDLFSGAFWTGNQAKTLGLVDNTTDLTSAAMTEFGTSTFVDYTQSPSFFEQLARSSSSMLKMGLGAELRPHVTALLR